MEPGKYLYARHHNICFLKFSGHITYTTSPDLDRFLAGLFKKPDFENILVDLTETSGIDSTNLGLLARIARFTLDRLGKKTIVLSSRPDVNRVLDTMGFASFCEIIGEPGGATGAWSEMPHDDVEKDTIARTILEAHRSLMEMNDQNREVFSNVVRFMEKEVGREGKSGD